MLELQAIIIQTPHRRLAEGSAIEADDFFGHQRRHQGGPQDQQGTGTLHGFKAIEGRARRQLVAKGRGLQGGFFRDQGFPRKGCVEACSPGW